METTWGIAAVWLGLALVASLLSIRFRMSVALIEILVGIAAGNLAMLLNHYQIQEAFGFPHWNWELRPNEWIAFLAGFGSILLTFMAGAEIEPALLRKYFKVTFAIGMAGFVGPFVGAGLYAYFVSGWDWNASLICGIALSTTSVAVVYAVMIETGLNETELGKIILAACFINDLGTVIALGACFASYNWTLAMFAAVAVAVLWWRPSFVAWFLQRFHRTLASQESSSSSSCCSPSGRWPPWRIARPCCRRTWSAWDWRASSQATATPSVACGPPYSHC